MNRLFYLALVVCLAGQFLPIVCSAQNPFDLPRLMDQDPKFEKVLPVVVFSEKLLPAWRKALNSDQIDLQRKAAESIVIVKSRGLEELGQVHAALLKKIADQGLHRQVRAAVAKAIVALDLREAEEDFLRLAESSNDPELQSIIQSALSQWNSKGAIKLWKANLAEESVDTNLRILAIEGLASAQESSVSGFLEKLVKDRNLNFRLRFAAARALARMTKSGLEGIAGSLYDSKRLAEMILATELVSEHHSQAGIQLLMRAAADQEPAVAYIAWSSLLGSSSARELDSAVESAMKNRGAKVRRSTIDLMKLWENQKAVEQIGLLLADLHPDVRIHARKTLVTFANEETLKPAVIQAAIGNLDANWQGKQQGILILAELDHKPAAEKIMSLLDHRRAEVHITAAWALEKLSVEKTLNPIFKRVEEKVESGDYLKFTESEHERIGHLIQLLGKNKFAPMERVIIRKLIPKDMRVLAFPTRPAAFWSIGKIYQGQQMPEELRRLLLQRLLDDDPMNPESSYVKSMCVFSFALTQTTSAIPNIEEYAEKNGSNSRFGFYCDWGLNQLDGREIPKVSPFPREDSDWFLYPLK